MSISTYSELQTAVASWAHRSDLTSLIPDFIALCEADLAIRCKLVDFEGTASVSVSAGTGALPADYAGFRAAKWDANPDRPLTYLTPDALNTVAEDGGPPGFYTVTGTSVKVGPGGNGTLILTYQAKLTALSNTNPSNTVLTRYPDAYLQGALLQAGIYARDSEAIGLHSGLYEAAVARIKTDNQQRKYPGPLQVRPR
jgi:hypothetical protein